MHRSIRTFFQMSRRKNVTLEELAGYDFLMREKGSADREIMDACFAVEQLSVRPAWESSSTQAIVQGVAAGLGVSVLPYLLVRNDIEKGIVSRGPIMPPLKRYFNIVYHKSKYLTHNMRSFIELCRKYGIMEHLV